MKGAVKLFSPKIGVCYGFNFKNTSRDDGAFNLFNGTAYSMYSGREFGLQLVVNIEGYLTILYPVSGRKHIYYNEH